MDQVVVYIWSACEWDSCCGTEGDAVSSMIGIPSYHTGRNLVDGCDGGKLGSSVKEGDNMSLLYYR